MSRGGPAIRRSCAAAAAAFVSLTAAFNEAHGAPTRFVVIDTTLGLVLVVSGLVAWERRPSVRTGPLLVTAAALWSVGSYAPAGVMPFALYGFAFERYYDVVFAYLALTFPDRRLARWDRAVLATLAGAFVVRSASRLLVECTCTGIDSPVGLVGDDPLFENLQFATSSVIVVAALGVTTLALLRLRRARPVGRRILSPVVAAGALAAVVTAYDALDLVVFVRAGRGLLQLDQPWGEIFSWTIISLVVLVAFGFLAGTLRMRIGHRVVARMAAELDSVDDPARLQVALRDALGDPELDLLLVDGAGRWVDATGRPADQPADQPDIDRVATMLAGPEGPLGAIVHDRSLNEDTGLMAATVSVLRFALENARLTATVRAQLAEVRASRTRLVAAGEAERRRIERDLHDGAQQRLIGVTLTLQQAREQARQSHPREPYVRLLDDASDELLAAVDELRELARGIHPAILTEAGLRPAVAGLARRSAVPVDLQVELTDRLDPSVEAAAYFIVAEALTNVTRHSGARRAAVLIERRNGHLRVQVSDDGAGGADPSRGTGLEGINDRLEAVSGVLEVDSPRGGGTRLRAEIPCV
jgi:signal transduction histidine kinase